MTQQVSLEVRPEGAFAEHAGVRIYYEVHGDGPPLLLHHGFSSTAERWRTFGYIDALKPHYRVIAMEARGHGRSDKPHDPAQYTLELRTGDVVAVLDATGVARVHYWGYSMGARTGFAFLQMHPDRAASFINGAAGSTSPKRHEQESLHERARLLRESPLEYGAARNAGFELNDFEALAAAALGLLSWDGMDPAMITVPTLHYAGDKDGLFNAARRAAERTPGAVFQVIPGHDHKGVMERSDLVLPFVREFLDAQPPTR
jgi:pimeloyl-ACP methyl ester carboxylesterase